MIKFVTGNILESSAECLINTVNCEGYMGKGIAYQFKLKFPKNNRDYEKACKTGFLTIGKLHCFQEDNKLIINFPTKNKWREKSKISYIHSGMQALVKLIDAKGIKSIAIPPLGCGNGGLDWTEVKKIIMDYLKMVSGSTEIIIYEPSLNYKPKIKEAPKLNASHLILMNFKPKLKRFNKLRLQKSAYFMNLFSNEQYFKFEQYKYGPYAHSIEILTKDIKRFQDYHGTDTIKAFDIAMNTLVSKSIEKKLAHFKDPLENAVDFVNSISTDKELEMLSTICSIVERKKGLNEELIYKELENWSEEKVKKFSKEQISLGIDKLLKRNILDEDIFGNYNINGNAREGEMVNNNTEMPLANNSSMINKNESLYIHKNEMADKNQSEDRIMNEELLKISKLARDKKRLNSQELEEIIIKMCSIRQLSIAELAEFLDRSSSTIKTKYLSKLLKQEKLQLSCPENHPVKKQFYKSVKDV
ncbi:type II toxin-antitoxin system antitoxin DNA ADP-ribosyl glycohydrolase DarG [Domibacillus tundrae]|uniref:type II toxin-antitoxin system antitoxin DNA ADP-ribosyl glycohydrolase DarG n=1 Tax=Domibacillus tundrae TaxID=1587527 RepID=UPI0009E308E3|nr:macro domain-containing protein [Domibacillus tundrae]